MLNSLPNYQKQGASAFKVGLDGIRALCEALGNPQKKLRAIHVAGTNGKGSTVAMLASVLQAAGFRVGTYTSPHLLHFRERIQLNGEWISEAEVQHFLAQYAPKLEKLEPSFFELTTALAFWYFAQQQVDFALIETGMGGREDATNIIQPILSIITSIAFDHQDFLGDSLGEIARHKAGIIKEKVPAIIGEMPEEATQIFQQEAKSKHSALIPAHSIFPTHILSQSSSHQIIQSPKHNYQLNLLGNYQGKNLSLVLAAIAQLQQQGYDIPQQAIQEGLQQVSLKGRMQVLQEQPLCLADVAHNEAGMQEVTQQLIQMGKHIHAVLGFVQGKSVENMLAFFPPDTRLYLCQAQLPRAYPLAQLVAIAQQMGFSHQSFPQVARAYQQAKQQAAADDLVFVGGSSFVVAEVLGI